MIFHLICQYIWCMMRIEEYSGEEVIHMTSNTIVRCESNPVRANITDWLMLHLGRTSVGREVSDDEVDILAYSDNKADSAFLHKMARNSDALCLVSIDEGGVSTID